MDIAGDIYRMVEGAKRTSAAVVDGSNLSADLGLDSLSFIHLLLRLEARYSIGFDLAEMEQCLYVGRLVKTVEGKLRGEER